MARWTVTTVALPSAFSGDILTRVRTDGETWEIYLTRPLPLPNGSLEEYITELKEYSVGLKDTDLEFENGNDEYSSSATVAGWRKATEEEERLIRFGY
ncbi:MAG: hypothetical protein H9W81_07775 [Enterococcus sp.]|nr:hypothetical protein [Enterococcus sp.]